MHYRASPFASLLHRDTSTRVPRPPINTHRARLRLFWRTSLAIVKSPSTNTEAPLPRHCHATALSRYQHRHRLDRFYVYLSLDRSARCGSTDRALGIPYASRARCATLCFWNVQRLVNVSSGKPFFSPHIYIGRKHVSNNTQSYYFSV